MGGLMGYDEFIEMTTHKLVTKALRRPHDLQIALTMYKISANVYENDEATIASMRFSLPN